VIDQTEYSLDALEQFQLDEVLRLTAPSHRGMTKCAGVCILPNCGAPCQKLPGHQEWCNCFGTGKEGVVRADSCATALYPRYDPGVHTSDLGDERVTVVSQPEPEPESSATDQEGEG